MVNPRRLFAGWIEDKKKISDMKWLTLEQIKQQLRIEPDFTQEDALLTTYGESAETMVLNVCSRTYEDFIEDYGEIPADIIHASLLLVGVSYQQHEAVSMNQLYAIPYAFDMKVKPYMRLSGFGDGAVMQTFVIGSDVKILIEASLPDDLLLRDVDFTVKVVNYSQKDLSQIYTKSECVETEDGNYVVLVNSEDLGIGEYRCLLTVYIPDTDYPAGTRKEVVKINPHVQVKG